MRRKFEKAARKGCFFPGGQRCPGFLFLEGQTVLVLFLEQAVDRIQNCLVLHGEVIFIFLVHRLHLEDHDLGGRLVRGHQHQIFLALVGQAVQILKVHILSVFVGQGQNAFFLFHVFVFHKKSLLILGLILG